MKDCVICQKGNYTAPLAIAWAVEGAAFLKPFEQFHHELRSYLRHCLGWIVTLHILLLEKIIQNKLVWLEIRCFSAILNLSG